MPTARPTADVSTTGWVTSTGSTSLFGALSDGDRTTYASSHALDARFRRGRRGLIVILTDDEDKHMSKPSYGRSYFDAQMNQKGTIFPNVEGAHSKCEAMRASEMANQYEQSTGITTGGCWKSPPGDPRPGISTVAADASDGHLAMDFTKTIYTALWGTPTHRNAFTVKIGKYINQWEGAQDGLPPFFPPGFDRASLISYNPESPGGGTIPSNGYQTYTRICNAIGGTVSQGLNLEGETTYPGSTMQNRHVHDWMADRLGEALLQWVLLDPTDPRYELPIFVELSASAPHHVAGPYPSTGAGLSAGEIAARQAIEQFYGVWTTDPTTFFIPPHFDYRRVQVLATGGTWRINYRGSLSGPIDWNAPASTVQAAVRAISNPFITGTETVTGGPGDATGSVPYTIKMVDCGDGDFTLPQAVVLTFDTSALVGTIDSAWPNIDVNDNTVQGTRGLYTTVHTGGGRGGPNGSAVTTECSRLAHLSAGVDRGLLKRVVELLTDLLGDGSIPSMIDAFDIIYTSDNGSFSGNGAHLRPPSGDTKDDCYNTDMEVPFVWRGVGIPQGAVNLAPMSLVQMGTLFLDLLRGVNTAADVQSVMIAGVGGNNNPSVGRVPDQLSPLAVITDTHAQDNKVFPMQGLNQNGVRIGNRWRYWNDTGHDGQQQTIDFGGCTSCTFTITFFLPTITVAGLIASMTYTPLTTAGIAYSASSQPSAISIHDALVAAGVPTGNVTVTLTGSVYKLTFGGTYDGATYAQANLPPVQIVATSVVGAAPDPGVSHSGHPAVNLYDFAHDPFELINLWGRSEYAGIESYCATAVATLQNCVGTQCYVGSSTSTTG